MTNPAHLSGPCHLDNFIMTPNARPSIGTMQKLMPTLTPLLRRGRLPATQLNRRAVSTNISVCDDYALAPCLKSYVLTRFFQHLYRDLPSRNRQSALAPSAASFCYKNSNTAFYRDSPIARRIKTCATFKFQFS